MDIQKLPNLHCKNIIFSSVLKTTANDDMPLNKDIKLNVTKYMRTHENSLHVS